MYSFCFVYYVLNILTAFNINSYSEIITKIIIASIYDGFYLTGWNSVLIFHSTIRSDPEAFLQCLVFAQYQNGTISG